MNHSILTASRTTHLKIVTVALIAAISVVTVGISARLSATDQRAEASIAKSGVVKATRTTTFTGAPALIP